MTPIPYMTTSFRNGMDLFNDPTKIAEDSYVMLINGRARNERIRGIKNPLEITGFPNGKFQGLYAAGNFAVVFVNGKAYYRDYANLLIDDYQYLPNLQMDPEVEDIFLQAVPASNINYQRELDGETTNLLATTISGSPVAAVVQDGKNQPWLILSNGATRITQKYGQWNQDGNREYVPIGKQMTEKSGVLYIVAPDGFSIYRSVTGRPLDFVIPVDADGNKLDDESIGGAKGMPITVGMDRITCISKVNDADGGIFVGTRVSGTIAIPDLTNRLFNEPFYKLRDIISGTGPRNQQSFSPDVNGDSCFIDDTGVRSFNAIQQGKNEGKNYPFSLNVSTLFEYKANTPVPQTYTATGEFDNYTLFAMNTIYGPAILFYDKLRQVWDSIDIYENVNGYIKQFAEVKTATTRILLFITSDNKLFQAFAGTQATYQFCPKEYCTNDPKFEQKVENVKCVFGNTLTDGTVSASLFTDRKFFRKLDKPLVANAEDSVNVAITPPFGDSSSDVIRNPTFDFSNSPQCWKAGLFIECDCESELTHIKLVAKPENPNNSMQQQLVEAKSIKTFLDNRA